MARHISAGIDIGTYQIKVVVAESASENPKEGPRVIGSGSAETKGMRHGYVINIPEATKSIKMAVRQAEKMAGVKISRVYLAVGGVGLSAFISIGSLVISRADSEIGELDVTKVVEVSENEIPSSLSLNRKILHTIPLQFKVDGKIVLGRPQGMKGSKLEVRTLFITSLSHHLNDIITAAEEAGVEVEDVMASPLAASLVTLSKTQKIAGCVLTNIGSETVSIVVFENDIPISLEIFPIGSNDITNDIALGLKIPLEEAELVKLGNSRAENYSKKKLDEIIIARLSDIFELIEAHLKKIGRNGLLPAGIIITGGGSGVATIEDLAKAALKLPSKKSDLKFEGTVRGIMKGSEWAVAYGLCILGLTAANDDSIVGLGLSNIRETPNMVWKWLKKFLP
jgi:cell division protein FtsA